MPTTVNPYSAEFFSFDSGKEENYYFLLNELVPITNTTTTSITAANTISKNYGKLAAMALDHIRNSGPTGITRGELCELMDKPQNSLTGALKQLERMKLIGTTGATRIWLYSGHSQQIYYSKRYL